MRIRHDVGKTVPKWGLSLIFGIMLVTLCGALTEAAVRHKSLLAHQPAPAGVAQPAPGQAGGPPPASIQEKMKRLQAAVHKLQEEGRDVSSVAQIAHEVGPLMDAGKFQEAEAVLDRALARAGELSSVEPVEPHPKNPQAPPAADAANPKPLPCPQAGAAIELDAGVWALAGDCTVSGLKLRGDAQLWVQNRALAINGNINLAQNAQLHVRGGAFTITNHVVFEYHISATGNARMDLRDVQVSTNAGVAGNLTSNYQGSDDSRLHIENVQIDDTKSWLLCNLQDRARLETRDSPGFPNEIYPHANSTVRIEGPGSSHRVWFFFMPGSSAVLENLPASRLFTFSFGRNTPGVKGIGYQVDVVNGHADFGIHCFPQSNVTVRNAFGNLGLDYQFSNVSAPETLTGLKGGRQSGTHQDQGRVLALENADIPPYGWQVYVNNDGIPLDKVAPITVTDSLINEMGAFKQGRFEAAHVQFAFAVIAAMGPSSMIHIRDSVINSQSILGGSDGIVKIEDSEIYGALVQATARSRILLLNTALRQNEPNPKCFPVLPSWGGVASGRCNPVNPAREVQFVARDHGMVLVAGIDPIATPIRSGSTYAFMGNAIVKMSVDQSYSYNLRYRQASASEFKTIASGVAGPKRAQALGELDTTGLAPGDYIVELELVVAGEEPIAVRRPFTVSGP